MALRPGTLKQPIDKQAILRNHPLFGKLGPEVIDRLASYAHTRSVKANGVIFRRGDAGASLFAVGVGTVKITSLSAAGKDAVFTLINRDEIFGEIALLDGRPRTADAIAFTDCELMVIDRRDFMPLIAGNPEIALRLIAFLCSRLRRTSEQFEDVLFLDMPARLAKQLLSLLASSKTRGAKLSITQREIGQIVGMSREGANKQLREWQEKNWLRLERGGITILDAAQLKLLASSDAEDSSDRLN